MSVFRVISSSGKLFYLAVTCMIAVKNDMGLKSPGIQRDFGVKRSEDQVVSYWTLRSKSTNQSSKAFFEK